MNKIIDKWKIIYSWCIPTIITAAYLIYWILLIFKKHEGGLLQDSSEYNEMLKTIVTFMSIVLSVYGFLIPSFLSSKGSSLLIQFFLDNIDIKYFSRQLKNIVAIGLLEILITCFLLITDIMPDICENVIILIWIWLLIFFTCSAYRFIGIMIKLMVEDNKENSKSLKNEVDRNNLDQMNCKIRKI